MPRPSTRRLLSWLLFTVLVGLGLVFYLRAVTAMWQHNPLLTGESKSYDQTFYMEHAAGIVLGMDKDDFPRSRMPLYPWLLHFFFEKELYDTKTLYERYMRFNVVVSIAALLGAFEIMRRSGLGARAAGGITLMTALHVHIYKAVLFQPELAFFTLYFLCFVLMWKSLQGRSWKWLLATGVCAGITHLMKGSALPMFFGFGLLLGCRQVWEWWHRRRDPDKPGLVRQAVPVAAFAGGFLLITGVFLFNSWKHYGSPFYDANSRYYFWAENSGEMAALQGTKMAIIKPQVTKEQLSHPQLMKYLPIWAKDPAVARQIVRKARAGQTVMLEGRYDILPGRRNYFRDHTLADAWQRIWDGLTGEHGILLHNFRHPNGYGIYVVLFGSMALAALLLAFLWDPRGIWSAVRRNLFPILFAGGSIIGCMLLYAWWAPVSNRNRFVLTQFLPVIFSLSVVLRACLLRLPVRLPLPWPRVAGGGVVQITLWGIFVATLWMLVIDEADERIPELINRPHIGHRNISQ